jgi:hypothetical protein
MSIMKIIHVYAAFLLLTVPHVSANFKMLVYDITSSSSAIGLITRSVSYAILCALSRTSRVFYNAIS